MAPLGALATLLMFVFLRGRLGDESKALAWSLVFALATPTLFRAAFLNQNAMVAHLVFAAWVLKVGLTQRPAGSTLPPRQLGAMGLILGFAMVIDFSAIPFTLLFGCWILADGWRRAGMSGALRDGTIYSAGVVMTASLLFIYQWMAFGHPLWPAQRYMPPTVYSVQGWLGFTTPTVELLWGNLFDPRYGLFAFCPLLLAAVAAPFIKPTSWSPSRAELGWITAGFAGLLLFSSANQFANLQWNTGVRYMVPLVPLLFLAALPVLASLPRALTLGIVGASGLISIAVSMYREDVTTSLRLLFTEGPTFPVLLVLEKMASGYHFGLPAGMFWIIVAGVGVVLWLAWRPWFTPNAERNA
jgi:hypothetical protein